MILRCDDLRISVEASQVKDIFPGNASSVFVISQNLPSVASRSGCVRKASIPEKFDGEVYLRDDDDTFRVVSNVPAGLSLPRSARDGKVEFTKGNKKIAITDAQFEALMSGKSVYQACDNLSLEDKRILSTGLTTEELEKLEKK